MRVVKLKKMKRIVGVHFAPDGSRLLACGGDEVWGVDDAVWIDVAKGEETSRIGLNADCYAVTDDLTRIALGSPRTEDGRELASVAWFDLDKPGNQSLPLADARPVYGLAISPDGKRLAVSHHYPVVANVDDASMPAVAMAVWSIGGKPKCLISFEDNDSAALTFDPAGNRLASSGGVDGYPEVRVMNMRLRQVTKFKPTGSRTRQLVYSPDGDSLAVVNGRNVYLLPADSTEPRLVLSGHPQQVNAVAFSPDGRRILSACHDKLVRVWDADSGELLHKYDWGLGAMTAIAFAPDGLTAAAGGEKGQVVFWDVD